MQRRGLRGISPLIATAILLAATFAVGYVIYNYVHTGTSAIAEKPQLMITASAKYVGGTAYVEISVRNAGGASANITKVTIDGTDVSSQLGIGASGYLLKPGQELHKVVTLTNLASGDHIVIVTLSDGKQFSATFTS